MTSQHQDNVLDEMELEQAKAETYKAVAVPIIESAANGKPVSSLTMAELQLAAPQAVSNAGACAAGDITSLPQTEGAITKCTGLQPTLNNDANIATQLKTACALTSSAVCISNTAILSAAHAPTAAGAAAIIPDTTDNQSNVNKIIAALNTGCSGGSGSTNPLYTKANYIVTQCGMNSGASDTDKATALGAIVQREVLDLIRVKGAQAISASKCSDAKYDAFKTAYTTVLARTVPPSDSAAKHELSSLYQIILPLCNNDPHTKCTDPCVGSTFNAMTQYACSATDIVKALDTLWSNSDIWQFDANL